MHKITVACFSILFFGNLAGCADRQLYETGQAYQRNQCNQMLDMGERQRCLEKADVSYEKYKKETEALGH
jgi:hypothetical protein